MRSLSSSLVALGVGGFGLLLALAVAVSSRSASLGDPGTTALRGLVRGLLYVGFLLVPVALAVVAARRPGLRAVLAFGFSPFAQAAIAAVLIVLA